LLPVRLLNSSFVSVSRILPRLVHGEPGLHTVGPFWQVLSFAAPPRPLVGMAFAMLDWPTTASGGAVRLESQFGIVLRGETGVGLQPPNPCPTRLLSPEPGSSGLTRRNKHALPWACHEEHAPSNWIDASSRFALAIKVVPRDNFGDVEVCRWRSSRVTALQGCLRAQLRTSCHQMPRRGIYGYRPV